MSANISADRPAHSLLGGWLPTNHEMLEGWISEKIRLLEGNPKPLHPVIKEFQELIEGDPFIYMGFHRMFEQIPQRRIAPSDSTCQPHIRDYKLLLELLNQILSTAPEFEDDDVVILPMYATFYWPMSTPAGLAMFSDPRVNAQLKKVLDVWSSFLTSPESRYVLVTADRGWFGPRASKKLVNFVDTFQCDPTVPYHGFASWDDFFTRSLRPGARPVAHPEDNAVITNPCESTVYHVAHGLQAYERFWLKGEPYSLRHMLAHDARADAFVGGTLYQATLSATTYHRWHSPVSGTVAAVAHIPGAYLAECPAVGARENPDMHNSQAFAACTATRAVVYIEADCAAIGLMAFVAVGLVEVSSCEVVVRAGDRLRKGDELGTFHFGGSTYCLLFRPQTRLTWLTDFPRDRNVPVNAALARAAPAL